MAGKLSPASLARSSARRPWVVVGVWVALFVVGGILSKAFLSDALTTSADFTNHPESRQAQQLLEQRLTGPRHANEIVIIHSDGATVDDPGFQNDVEKLAAAVRATHVVERVSAFPQSPDPSVVSKDRHTELMPVVMSGSIDDATNNIDKVLAVTLHAQQPAGFRVLVAGEATAGDDFKTLAENDLKKGEGFGIIMALLILLVVFGAVAAAVVPIILAVMSIAIATGIVAVIGQILPFSFFVTNMITMMGLAVGIDYSLFIISRYREERSHGKEKLDAIEAAGATASRAVFFSGMTVMLALLGMLIVPTTIFRSLALGAISVVLVAVLASLTLLPAVLGLMGDHVNALRVFRRRGSKPAADSERGFWTWAARKVMAKPVISLVVAAGILVAAGASLFGIRTGFSGVSTLPDGVQSKQAFEVLAKQFSGGLTQPAQLVIDGPVTSAKVTAAIQALETKLATDPAFGPPAPLVTGMSDANIGLISVPLAGDPATAQAADAVRRLRSTYIPAAFAGSGARVLVGGQPAVAVDFFHLTNHFTPIAFVFVLGLSFLLLMVVFRSLVVPLKAIILNLLSVGAAYGLIVLVNQKGALSGVTGFQRVDVIEAWLPLFLFSVLFGLSMDYHVFLLSRIRERYDHTHDNAGAVAFGLRSTGGIITGAALIMVAVFAGFAAGHLVSLQEMGFGLAVAVLLDATIVRSVLVPATMELLGDRNWYLPRWLQWLPQIRVESQEAQHAEAELEHHGELAGVKE